MDKQQAQDIIAQYTPYIKGNKKLYDYDDVVKMLFIATAAPYSNSMLEHSHSVYYDPGCSVPQWRYSNTTDDLNPEKGE